MPHIYKDPTEGSLLNVRLRVNIAMATFTKEIEHPNDAVCEIVGLSICNHPRIIKPLGITFLDDKAQIILPKLIPLCEYKCNSFTDRLQLIYDITCAMAYLRDIGIMHRDIKEHNIVCENGRAKLIDFNLCVFVVGSLFLKPCSTITHRAPEVEKSIFDNTADIWSLGLVIYRIITGHSWKDMAYDSGWFVEEYDERWIKFMLMPETIERMEKCILDDPALSCVSIDEQKFLIRLMKGCLQLDEHRITEAHIINLILRHDGIIADCHGAAKLTKRLSPEFELSEYDSVTHIIKSQVSYIRDHMYGVIKKLFDMNIKEEQIIYAMVQIILNMYDVSHTDAQYAFEYFGFEYLSDIHKALNGNYRDVLFE